MSASLSLPVRVSCDSAIAAVVVYPRGALVSRTVRVPEGLASDRCELILSGLPGEVRPATVRVQASGQRRVTATRARVVTPQAASVRTEARAARASLLKRRRAVELLIAQGEITRRSLTEATSFEALPGDRRFLHDPAAYVAHALAMTALLDELSRDTDKALRALVSELGEIRARLAGLDVAEQAAPSPHESEPLLEVRIELGPGEGPPGLLVEYVVPSARYWPAYTVRFTERGTRASVSFEPFVVQTSGEDWRDVRVSIATGDLVTDGALPKLPSLRFGRAQIVKSSGYRPLPTDGARLFAGFDAAWKRGRLPATPEHERIAHEAATAAHAVLAAIASEEAMAMPLGGASSSSESVAPQSAPSFGAPLPPPRGKAGLFSSFGGGAPMPSSPSMSRAPAAAPGEGGSAPHKARRTLVGSDEGTAHATTQATTGLAPPDELLDFDGLSLPPPHSADRGRLIADAPVLGDAGLERQRAFLAMCPPPGVRDPESSGAIFDHVFHGTTTCHVPSSARPVRITVDRRTARAAPRLTVVPRETLDVFREADVDNPFDAPLLPGPIDVFLDGSLVAETALSLVDRGGKLRVGMGVEDRVKIARNARVEEKSAGLLGGQRTVDHAITIDVVSALPFTSYLEIRDRMPFADDASGVDAKLVTAAPAPSTRDLGGAGERLRGGLLWHLELAAGGAAKVSFTYRLSFSAKDEIVGGNRRD